MATAFPSILCASILLAGPALARDLGSFDRTITVTGPVDLDVGTNSGRIEVRTGDSNAVRIHAVISVSNYNDSSETDRRAQEIQSNPPISQSGNSIRIDRLDDFAARHLAISYEVTAPARTRLHSRTGSGGQSVEDIQGPVTATTGSGGIRIHNVAEEVSARTGSGEIDLESIRGRVEATTGSGGIRGMNLSGPVTGRAGSGGITLRLPSTSGFELRAQTGSGRVYVDPPITMQSASFGGHQVRGQIRGGGPLIDLSTGSGGIRIE